MPYTSLLGLNALQVVWYVGQISWPLGAVPCPQLPGSFPSSIQDRTLALSNSACQGGPLTEMVE